MALLTDRDPPVPLEGVLSPREFGRVGALLLGSAAVIGAIAMAALAIVGGHPAGPGFHPLPIGFVCVSTFAGAAVLLWRSERFVPPLAAAIIALAVVLIGVSAWYSGSVAAPFTSMFFAWVGTAYVLLPARVAAVEVGFAGLVDAIVLAEQKGHVAPLGSWTFTFGVTALTAWVVKRVVDEVMATAANERAARAEAQRGNQELEDLSDRETAFLTQISHEVRTPLNVIIGFADMLGEGLVGSLNEQQAEYVAEVQTSGHHLLGLIGELVDVAKVEEGSQDDLELVEFQLDDVLAPAVGLFRGEAERRGVRLELTSGAPIVVRGDERKIRQVVLNLLSNAVKFTPAGGWVNVAAAAHGGVARVAVSDTGPGIEPADVDRIFEEYGQARAGAAARTGTGLGLPLARHFAELHGGTLEVTSTVGTGSVFTVRLPVAGPPARRPLSASEPVVEHARAGRWQPLEHPDLGARLVHLPPLIGFGAVGMSVVMLLADLVVHSPGYRRAPLAAFAALGLVVVVGLAARRRPLSPAGVAVLAAGATVGFSLGSYFMGPAQGPYAAMLYVIAALAAVAFLPRAAVGAMVAFIGANYAVVLVAQRGNPAPVARWVVVMGMVTVSAAALATLLDRLGALGDAERRARLRLEVVRSGLEAASRHKTQFLATMSHELRTPLNAIIGFSEVLQDELFGPLTGKQREYASDLAEAGHQLLALVNDILDLAKLDAGRMDLELTEDADAAASLAAACGRPLAVPVEMSLGEVRPMTLDDHKVRRIVANLVDEAAAISGVTAVRVAASSSDDALTVDVDAVGATRPEPLAPPLRVAVAAAFASLHGGRLDPTPHGWRCTLPVCARAPEPA